MPKRRSDVVGQAVGLAPGQRPGLRDWQAAALIVLAGLLAYLPALSAGFIFDDDSFLTANPLVRAADGLRRFWFTSQAVDYWPVTSTTLWAEWRLWGLHAAGYHVTNLLLHLGECVLLWALLRRLRVPGALLAALLFAVHPVNAESVVWITQRKNLMAMLFLLASIYWWVERVVPNALVRPAAPLSALGTTRSTYWLSLLAFALAMLSKGSVAPLPLVLLGLIAWHRRVSAADLIKLVPFFLVAGALTLVDVRFAGHGPDDVIRSAGLLERLQGAGAVIWFYLGKAILPIDLSFNYPQWSIRAEDFGWWIPLLAAAAVTGVLLARLRAAGRGTTTRQNSERRGARSEIWGRRLIFAWGYFCVMLLPVMGFTDVYFMKYSLVSDHYQHLAIIGVVVLAAAGWSEWRARQRWPATAAAAAVVCLLGALTWRQCEIYGSLETLYRTTIERNPAAWMAHNNLGSLLQDSGRTQEAIAQDAEALRLQPGFPGVHYNLGVALTSAGRLPEAAAQLEEALRLDPGYVEAHINLAKLLHDAGRREEAFFHLQEAVRYRPDDPEAHNDLGNMLDEAGREPEAIAEYEKAVQAAPDSALAQANLGDALGRAGRLDEAIAHYERGLRANPGDARLHRRLAGLLAQAGRMTEANAELERSTRPPAP